jgi:transcriptional regulator with XRE-family HTH domain
MSPTHATTFGQYLSELRRQKRISARKICIDNRIDSTEYAKIESDELVPTDDEFFATVTKSLLLDSTSKEYLTLSSLLEEARSHITEVRPTKLAWLLPAFFRNAYAGKPTKDDLLQVIDLIKKA